MTPTPELAAAAIRRIRAERRMPYWLRWLMAGLLLGMAWAELSYFLLH